MLILELHSGILYLNVLETHEIHKKAYFFKVGLNQLNFGTNLKY